MKLELISPKYGKFVVYYDDEDHELISKYRWGISVSRGKNFTVRSRRSSKGETHHAMHRLVLGIVDTKDGLVIHLDGDVFNNRKDNLIYNDYQRFVWHKEYCEMIVYSKKVGQHSVIFDSDYYDTIRKYRWYVSKQRKTYYAYAKKEENSPQIISLHRLLMGFPTNLQVDHINHNGLDNRMINIRVGTHSQNSMNKDKQANNSPATKVFIIINTLKNMNLILW